MQLRTDFRGKLLLLAIGPLFMTMLVMLIVVIGGVQSDIDRRARESLVIGGSVVGEYLSSRSDQLRTSVEILAADFGFKEAAVTGDADTLRSVLRNLSRRAGAEHTLLLDVDGGIIASTHDISIEEQEHISAMFGDGSGGPARHLIQHMDGSIFQEFAVPLRAPTTIGWIVVGFRVDSPLVERLAALTGLGVAVIVATDRSVVTASESVSRDLGISTGNLFRRSVPTGSSYLSAGPSADYLALNVPLLPNESEYQVLLLRSLSEAMAPYVTARRGLIALAVLLLFLVTAGAIWISGTIAKPLRLLTKSAREVSSGRYDLGVPVSSDDEFGELASSFNAMRTAIGEREKRISHQSLHNHLTDLPNRVKVITELANKIQRPVPADIAILSVRLSRMNEIASTLGHKAADDLTVLAARQLSASLDPGAHLGHVGTNEFAIVLADCDIDGAIGGAEKIEKILGAGVVLGQANIALRTEIGIATFPQHGSSPDDLLRNAMIARNEARVRGEACVVYEAGREEHYIRQLRIVNDLRGAIEKRQLCVHYQPKISLPTGTICGAEALVRWQHPEYGWLPPDEFIPAAEEAGIIQHVTHHVLACAIAECETWQNAGYTLQISANISAQDLQDEYLPYFLLELLGKHGLAPHRVTLEVTENALMRNIHKAIAVLECLRDIGVRISMDDFGTGNSSLTQLKNIPLHELKIDKSFVMNLRDDEQNEAIVRSTLQLARNMNIVVVAEGVEDEQTLRYLSEAGCQQAQGYFLSRPICSEDLLVWLRRWPVTSEIEPVAMTGHSSAVSG